MDIIGISMRIAELEVAWSSRMAELRQVQRELVLLKLAVKIGKIPEPGDVLVSSYKAVVRYDGVDDFGEGIACVGTRLLKNGKLGRRIMLLSYHGWSLREDT